MKLTAQIDSDCKCMKNYFTNLLKLLNESREAEALSPTELYDLDADESQSKYHGFSHFIKPDMVINIYSLVDYWMTSICEYHRKSRQLSLKITDIKGHGDLDARHKYLTKYANINLDGVKDSYKHLGQLRKIRNKFIHGGGHINSDKEDREFSKINGITISGTLIIIEESFIWSKLYHAQKYLLAAVKA